MLQRDMGLPADVEDDLEEVVDFLSENEHEREASTSLQLDEHERRLEVMRNVMNQLLMLRGQREIDQFGPEPTGFRFYQQHEQRLDAVPTQLSMETESDSGLSSTTASETPRPRLDPKEILPRWRARRLSRLY
ncbi:hypothetical protein HDU97_009976 [Phlyctochytrium planicorne]|nr:hypothetical protein HDU97_009976 [Phlyctochytrium planicorne]